VRSNLSVIQNFLINYSKFSEEALRKCSGELEKEFRDNFFKLKDLYVEKRDEILEKNKITADQFNIFRILKVERYEVTTHSALLKELLDSRGSHGQGNLFFINFLYLLANKDIIPKDEINKYSPKTFDDYRCNAELTVNTGRLDIIIERTYGDFRFCIIIENKVDAADQDEQIDRYWIYLKSKSEIPENRKKILYLTKIGELPSYNSIKLDARENLAKNGVLYYISYSKDIIHWLNEVLPKVESKKVSYLIKQYIETIQNLNDGRDE